MFGLRHEEFAFRIFCVDMSFEYAPPSKRVSLHPNLRTRSACSIELSDWQDFLWATMGQRGDVLVFATNCAKSKALPTPREFLLKMRERRADAPPRMQVECFDGALPRGHFESALMSWSAEIRDATAPAPIYGLV